MDLKQISVSAPRLSVGDIVVLARDHDVEREIVAVRRDGYEWRYPDVPDRTFLSADSTDPHFTSGNWLIKTPSPTAE